MKADTQISSLFRRPTANGDKWVVSGRIKGENPTKITIGYCSIINVTEARKIAKQHLAEMAQGINPNHRNKVTAARIQYGFILDTGCFYVQFCKCLRSGIVGKSKRISSHFPRQRSFEFRNASNYF